MSEYCFVATTCTLPTTTCYDKRLYEMPKQKPYHCNGNANAPSMPSNTAKPCTIGDISWNCAKTESMSINLGSIGLRQNSNFQVKHSFHWTVMWCFAAIFRHVWHRQWRMPIFTTKSLWVILKLILKSLRSIRKEESPFHWLRLRAYTFSS